MRADRESPRGAGASRVAVLHVRNRLTHATRTSEPLSVDGDAKQRGIAIGRDACHLDPLVSVAHGTLECTPQHGVWVYVDHSEHGTTLNHKQLVHRDAAIVRDGDVLSLGNTEITLAFQVQSSPRDDHSNNNQASVGATRSQASPVAMSPSPPTTPMLPSQLARQMLPNIQTTAARVQQPPPEYINSPIPGTNWRKKRHSISHVGRHPMTLAGPNASLSASQTFARSKPLVPSAPSTPPQKDAPAARHVSHHVSHHSPQSAYYHVKFKDEPETITPPQTIPENEPVQPQRPHQDADGSTSSGSNQPTPPPLEYSSSPVTSAAGMSLLSRLQNSPSSAQKRVHAPKPSPPSAPASAAPFLHAHHFDTSSVPARASSRPMDLRIQVAKRNAGLASAAAAGRAVSGTSTTTPKAVGAVPSASAAARPVPLSRGITIPTTATAQSSSSKATTQRRLEFTPPASPVAHQDILRQNQSLLNILKNKYKEEEKLKREQEEWMRTQFPSSVASSPSGSATVPSMSPIRHDKDGSVGDNNDNGSDDDDEDLVMPAKAPALLRTVSLGQTNPIAAHHYHQPSPRLTQAVLASRARKGSFDGGRHHHHVVNALLSPRGDISSLVASSNLRVRSSSGDSSVASSVSTEPSNHRRVMRSVSISSSRANSSGELSDFLGYDDDDAEDGLVSFTTYYGDGGLDDTIRAPTTTTQRTPARSRLPSLDDEMAGVLNSPSHASSSSFGRHSAFETSYSSSSTTKEPRSVAKPRARSADVRRAKEQPRSRRMHQLGIDLERRSPSYA